MAEPAYQYIRRAYGLNPGVGQRVRHTETKRLGTIAPESKGQAHHVMVTFDGQKFALPCHPCALDYAPMEDSDAG